jgi:hypothetical protein
MSGRTSAESARAIQVRVQPKLFIEIENFRRGEADLPTRPEAVRRLLNQAVAARNAGVEVGGGLGCRVSLRPLTGSETA